MDGWPGFLQSVLAAAAAQGAPLLLVALGEIICERAGVLNLGAEGMMLMGAVCGFAACNAGSSLPAGAAAAMLVGGAFSLVHALLSVTFRANQIVSGLALSILGLGLSSFIGERLDLVMQPAAMSFGPIPIPFASRIPFLGEALFRQGVLTYLAYALAAAAWFMLFRTRLGLRIRSVGESPLTADAMGVSVPAVRWLCVGIGGVMAGLGGACLDVLLQLGDRPLNPARFAKPAELQVGEMSNARRRMRAGVGEALHQMRSAATAQVDHHREVERVHLCHQRRRGRVLLREQHQPRWGRTKNVWSASAASPGRNRLVS